MLKSIRKYRSSFIKKRLAILPTGLILISLSGLIYASNRSTVIPTATLSPEEANLAQKINSLGGPAAFAYFKDQFGQADPVKTHSLGHFLGEELYRKVGLGTVAICDFTQNWSCYHGFFAEALKKEGKGVIAASAKICESTNLPARCLDSIGHGLLYVEGYSRAGMLAALGDCDSISPPSRISCYRGVFKEYNDREIWPMAGESVSRKVPEELLEPCRSSPEAAQAICFYEQPYWWRVALKGDFKKMGDLCLTAPAASQESCFRGVGRAVLALTYYNSDGSAGKRCAEMPSQGLASCILEEVSILSGTYGEQKYRDETHPYTIPAPTTEFCNYLVGDSKESCLEKVKSFECSKLKLC